MRPAAIAAAAAAAAAALAGCASSTPSAAPEPSHSSAPPSSPAAFSCQGNRDLIAGLARDQRRQDRTQEENWVNLDGTLTTPGDLLSYAVQAWARAPTGGSFAGDDARALSRDARIMFRDQRATLGPVPLGDYRTVRGDILRLARDCGVRPR